MRQVYEKLFKIHTLTEALAEYITLTAGVVILSLKLQNGFLSFMFQLGFLSL